MPTSVSVRSGGEYRYVVGWLSILWMNTTTARMVLLMRTMVVPKWVVDLKCRFLKVTIHMLTTARKSQMKDNAALDIYFL